MTFVSGCVSLFTRNRAKGWGGAYRMGRTGSMVPQWSEC